MQSLVESALLDHRLKEDIKRVGPTKRCHSLPPADLAELRFYLPRPGDRERDVFEQYVLCRWPIHVFALDPVTQEQNVQDVFSRRREMQLALALAFAGGNIGAQNMTRFVRRLELDMETIALNRTIVGFSHGNETFGWRFYPRVQTPPEKGSAEVLFRDLLLGGAGREQDYRQRQLEPGMRECTAIVIMPSFVPYVVFDVRSNWFHLTNPKRSEMSMRQTLDLSKMIRSMQDSAAYCIRDAHKYRDGEVERLLRRVDQLSAELPLQTMLVQVPHENTLGGFEMFSTGITDLAPELYGFYGAPGVTLGRDTVFFLVGNNFSVHDTRVIAGNVALPKEYAELVSRQIMRVRIPWDVQPVDVPFPRTVEGVKVPKQIIDVHVATPYGVTTHLEIPVIEPKKDQPPKAPPEPKARFSWSKESGVKMFFYYDCRGTLFMDQFQGTSAQPPKTVTLRLTYDDFERFKGKFKMPEGLKLAMVLQPESDGLRPKGPYMFPLKTDPAKTTWTLPVETIYKQIEKPAKETLGEAFDGPNPAGLQVLKLRAVCYVQLSDGRSLPIRVDGDLPIILQQQLFPRKDCDGQSALGRLPFTVGRSDGADRPPAGVWLPEEGVRSLPRLTEKSQLQVLPR